MRLELRWWADEEGGMKPRLLVMAMLLAMVVVSRADEPKARYRLEKDTGWNVCHTVLRHLESLPPPEDRIGCEIPSDPKSKALGEPAWEELNIEAHWDMVYAMETKLSAIGRGGQRIWKDCVGCQSLMGRPDSELKIPPMAAWRDFYEANMRSGVVQPRLRRTKVRFASDGPEETLLAYTPERHNVERCKRQMVRGELLYETGEYIFPLDPDSGRLTYILPTEGKGGGSHILGSLVTHGGSVYLASLYPVGQAILVSRVYRGPKLVVDRDLHYFDQQICEIVGLKPLQTTK